MRQFFHSNLGVALLGSGLLAALVAWALALEIEEVKVEPFPPDQPLSVSRKVDIVGQQGDAVVGDSSPNR